MVRRKKSSSAISETQIAQIVEGIVKKKIDLDFDIFLKKYMSNFLRDFENKQRKELANSLLSGIFGAQDGGRGSNERQIMSSLFNNLLRKIF